MLELIKNSRIQIKVALKQEIDRSWLARSRPEDWLNVSFNRLYLPIKGEAYISFNHHEYRLRRGFIYLIPPHVRVNCRCPEYLLKYWAHFNIFISNSTLDIFSVAPAAVELPVADWEWCRQLFEQLLIYTPQAWGKNKEKHIEPLDEMSAHAALMLLLKPFWATMALEEKQKNNPLPRFLQLLIFIEKNLDQELSLNTLADFMHLNPVYLSNLFCEVFGVPLIRYCNQRRCQVAADWLANSALTIEEIAYKLGSENPAAFSRLFHRHLGCSPWAYRKLAQKNGSGEEPQKF